MKIKKINKLISLVGVMGLAVALMLSQAVTLLAETVEPSQITGTHNATESKVQKYPFEYKTINDGTIAITDLPTNYSGELVIPKQVDGKYVTKISAQAFLGCINLIGVTIPDSVSTIGNWAFSGCSKLTSITIPASVSEISSWAFDDCSSLTDITVSSSNENYTSQNGVLYNKDKTTLLDYPAGKKDTSFTVPSSVVTIGDWAFNCSKLKSITIPNSVEKIGLYAFEDCSDLEKITIPNSVTEVGSYAFEDCSSLTNITIPNSVTAIGYYAFFDCSNLTSITIAESVESIGDYAFLECPKVTIYVKSDNEYIKQYAKDNDIPYKVGDVPTTKPLKPTNTKAVAESTEVIKVIWNKVSNADGYEVYRFVNGRSVFYKAFDENTTTFNNAGKKPNTTYYYKIRAYKVVEGEKIYSGYTDLFTCTTPKTDTKPLKPTNIKAVAQSTEVIKVTWDKVSNADGYEVYRFVNGRSVFYKAFDEDTTTFNNAGKKPNTTYYYKIRSYKVVEGEKIYSGYTDLFTCTTPKK